MMNGWPESASCGFHHHAHLLSPSLSLSLSLWYSVLPFLVVLLSGACSALTVGGNASSEYPGSDYSDDLL